ncbi:hypothetical protein GW17_00033354 [Ensete ventricosum]|nr:hypothetical protein GW17_00033354 [Ensete ventricosum]RZR96380.1 hypothetical protein BHM03_00025386 [Ensete ventricosum]
MRRPRPRVVSALARRRFFSHTRRRNVSLHGEKDQGGQQTNWWKYAFQEGLAPINLVVENEFHRAAPGGTGGVKTIGNYASVSELITSVEQASLITALAFRLLLCSRSLSSVDRRLA